MNPEIRELPVLHRAFRIERGSAKEDSRQITLSIASSEPCERWFGNEVLSLEPSAIRLGRFKQGAALLFNHSADKHIGKVRNPRVQGSKLFVDAIFSKSALGEEKYQDCLAQILCDSSIGYIVHRYEVDEDNETYLATDWEPLEASLTPIPADVTTGIGRSENNKTYPVQILTRTHNMQNENENQQPGQPQRRMTRTQEADHAQKIHEFVDALRNPAWKQSAEAIGERSILEGKTFTEFREAALQTFTTTGIIDTPFPEQQSNRGHGGINNRSIGAQIVAHREIQQLFRGSKKTVSFELPGSSIRSLGTGDFGGTVQHLGAPIFENQRLTIADLLAGGTTTSGTVRYPRENSFTPGATSVGEAGQKAEQAFDVSPIDEPARKIAAWTRISSELLQDAPAAEAYISSRLEFAVLREEERQILFGDGLGTNLRGIFTNAGVQTQAKGADTAPDAIRKAIGNVAINSDFEASGIVINPLDWQNIELLKTTTGEYLVGNVFVRSEMGTLIKAPSVWGLPVVVTKSTPAGTALVGDFARAAQLFRRQGVLIEMSNVDGDNFTRNLVTVLAELRALVATYAPNAFSDVTGL